jgi:hypothetical protein
MAESDFYLPDAGQAFPTTLFLLAVDVCVSLCVIKTKNPPARFVSGGGSSTRSIGIGPLDL